MLPKPQNTKEANDLKNIEKEANERKTFTPEEIIENSKERGNEISLEKQFGELGMIENMLTSSELHQNQKTSTLAYEEDEKEKQSKIVQIDINIINPPIKNYSFKNLLKAEKKKEKQKKSNNDINIKNIKESEG